MTLISQVSPFNKKKISNSNHDDQKIFIVGSPNVGKSVIFNSLTGRYVVVSNYPGTTVEVSRGTGKIGPAIAAGCEYHLVRLETMQLAFVEIERHDAPARTVLHDQVDGEVFNIELRIVFE